MFNAHHSSQMNRKSQSDYQNVEHVQSQLFIAQNSFLNGFLNLEEIGEYIPGSVMVQDLHAMTNTYMNHKGCQILNKSKEELAAMGSEYFCDFFPVEEVSFFLAELRIFADRGDHSSWYSFFQRVRADAESDYEWYFTTCRLYSRPDDADHLLMMNIALPVSGLQCGSKKIDHLTGDTEYVRINLHRYKNLTQREKQIIALIVQGKGSSQISDELFISIHTVNNHRKSIINKVGDRSLAHLIKFAEAFHLL
jgi:LuxR family transcriptional regulator